MARLNTRPSSRYASEMPGPASGAGAGDTSDQENHDPVPAIRMDKGKGRAVDRPSRVSLPTPASDSSNEARGVKRKRLQPQRRATEVVEEDEDDAPEEEEEEEVDEEEGEAAKFVRYFDPNQDPEVRREIKRKSRALEREFQGEH